MTFREEILECLGDKMYTEEVIEIFEKTIDKLKQEYPLPIENEDISHATYLQLLAIDVFYHKLKGLLKK